MRRTLVLVAMAVVPSIARAEPTDLVSRPLVQGAGQLAAELVTEINLAHRKLASPLSLSPDVWFGVTPRWTLGIVHSNPSVDRFSPGASLCVRKDEFLCDAAYHGSSIDARWSVREGALAVAPRARMLVRELDPFKPALTLGALVRWTRSRYAIIGDPYLQLGLAHRDLGNRASLVLPVSFAIQPTCRWQITLRTGWHSELAVIRDGWHIPLALEARARASERVDVAAMVAFASALGPQNTPKERALFLTVGWR